MQPGGIFIANEQPANTLTASFSRLLHDTRGVEQVFVFSLADPLPQNSSFKPLAYLIRALSEKITLSQMVIQTAKKSVIVHITSHFVLGTTVTKDANFTLVNYSAARLASKVDPHYARYQEDGIEDTGRRIQERMNRLMELEDGYRVNVALQLDDFKVVGRILLVVGSKVDEKNLEKEIEKIINEEIPFYCSKNISVDIETETGLNRVKGVTRHQLSRIAQKIQR